MRAPPRSATIVGIAVATMVTSTAAMNIAIKQAAVTRRLRMTMSAEKGGGLARSTANVGFQSWLDPTVLKFACTRPGSPSRNYHHHDLPPGSLWLLQRGPCPEVRWNGSYLNRLGWSAQTLQMCS